MTLPAPNLDDKSFEDLVREAVSRIPIYAPSWTDHNATDPGITLIELFAWLTEMQIYRLNRITEGDIKVFLKTLGIWVEDGETIEAAISRARADLKKVHRAVTSEDYEDIVMKTGKVSRVKAIAGYYPGMQGYVPNTVSLIIVPAANSKQLDLAPIADDNLIADVYDCLEEYRLLATEIYVLPAEYICISVTATVVKKPQYLEATVRDNASSELKKFLDPSAGGPEGKGWPFGRPVFLSEICQVLANCRGVDYVESVNGFLAEAENLVEKNDVVQGNVPEKVEIPRRGLVISGKIDISFAKIREECGVPIRV